MNPPDLPAQQSSQLACRHVVLFKALIVVVSFAVVTPRSSRSQHCRRWTLPFTTLQLRMPFAPRLPELPSSRLQAVCISCHTVPRFEHLSPHPDCTVHCAACRPARLIGGCQGRRWRFRSRRSCAEPDHPGSAFASSSQTDLVCRHGTATGSH